MNSRFSRPIKLALAIALAVEGCAGGDQRSVSKNNGAQGNVTPQSIAVSGTKYRNPDGSMDYDAMRSEFGEPNAKLVLNERATDISKTASAATVAVGPHALVFSANDAQSLLAHVRAGDTLYCGHECEGADAERGQFVRNVVSVTRNGDQIVVATTDGALTDIIHSGWLHVSQEMPFDIGYDPETKQHFAHPHLEASGSPSGSKSASGSANVAGVALQITGTVKAELDYDIVVSLSFSLPPVSITTCNVTVKVTPSVDVTADWSASGSLGPYNQTLFPTASFTIPTTAGVIELSTTASLGATAQESAAGSITLNATGHADYAIAAGFTYTSANGAAGIPPSGTPTLTATFTGTANANADAHVTLTFTLTSKVYGLAGPTGLATATAGIKVTGSANAATASTATGASSGTSTSCSATVTAQLYFTVDAQAGISVVGLSPFLWDIGSKTYPWPLTPWTKTFMLNNQGTCGLSTSSSSGSTAASSASSGSSGSHSSASSGSNGSASSGSNGSASSGSSGSNSGSGSSSSGSTYEGDGGATTANDGPCGSDNSCPGTDECCDNGDAGANQCIDTQADVNNCGSCGQNCPTISGDPTSACSSGKCSCTCAPGSTLAGMKCPDGVDQIGCS